MKKITQRQIDKLFVSSSHDIYDKFVENVAIVYANLFPEKCTMSTFDDAYYDLVRQRLMLEMSVLYNEAKGEKNAKKKCKAAFLSSKRAVVL